MKVSASRGHESMGKARKPAAKDEAQRLELRHIEGSRVYIAIIDGRHGFVNVQEAQQILGCSHMTIYRLLRSGSLRRPRRIGRISLRSIDRYLRQSGGVGTWDARPGKT